MIGSARVNGKRLADLCHRLAISTESGIDIRRTWQREAENARGKPAEAFKLVRDSVAAGETLSDAIAETGGTFPRLFREMTQVGEQTGSLAEVFHRLSDHYQQQFEMMRELRRRLAWPMMQLAAALVIIGLMMVVLSVLGLKRINGQPIDILGFGLTGMQSLAVYIQMILLAGLAIGLLIVAFRNEAFGSGFLQRLLMQIPSVGPAVQKICLARMTWAMHLTLNVEMDLRQLIPLVLRATGSEYYTRCSNQITSLVAAGNPMHEAFSAAGIFPHHFLESLQVAEESGQLVESMSRLSKQYQEEADSAIDTLSTVFSFAVWGLVMVIIGAMVIRLFKVVYVDAINDALNL